MKDKLTKLRIKIEEHEREIGLVTIYCLAVALGVTKFKLDVKRAELHLLAATIVDLDLHEQVIDALKKLAKS